MKILGIDPAPAKNSVVFDGETFVAYDAQSLKHYIDAIDGEILIGWDAPLDSSLNEQFFSLTIREIERYFYRQGKTAKALKIPQGISTLGYASCPHWTISQYIFSLPIINHKFQKSHWHLIVDNSKQFKQKNIVEVHPALSMWLMLKDNLKDPLFQNSWQYKGSGKDSKKRLGVLVQHTLKSKLAQQYLHNDITIKTDDELDAFVSWLLTKAFHDNSPHAKLFGDKTKGAFLLYYTKDLENGL